MMISVDEGVHEDAQIIMMRAHYNNREIAKLRPKFREKGDIH
jgi:hypothetical protein